MDIIIIILIIVVIWLISNSHTKENFYGTMCDPFYGSNPNSDYCKEKDRITSVRYGYGFCHRDYTPNKNNYYKGTDCGLGDGVFEDWRNKGGHCPGYFTEDSNCGTGCRNIITHNCADPYPKGFCHLTYEPNKNNYHGGTDCGLGDGVFDDWVARGGQCPDGYHKDSGCGTGCANGWGSCADP
jgi:hypothetical protein